MAPSRGAPPSPGHSVSAWGRSLARRHSLSSGRVQGPLPGRSLSSPRRSPPGAASPPGGRSLLSPRGAGSPSRGAASSPRRCAPTRMRTNPAPPFSGPGLRGQPRGLVTRPPPAARRPCRRLTSARRVLVPVYPLRRGSATPARPAPRVRPLPRRDSALRRPSPPRPAPPRPAPPHPPPPRGRARRGRSQPRRRRARAGPRPESPGQPSAPTDAAGLRCRPRGRPGPAEGEVGLASARVWGRSPGRCFPGAGSGPARAVRTPTQPGPPPAATGARWPPAPRAPRAGAAERGLAGGLWARPAPARAGRSQARLSLVLEREAPESRLRGCPGSWSDI